MGPVRVQEMGADGADVPESLASTVAGLDAGETKSIAEKTEKLVYRGRRVASPPGGQRSEMRRLTKPRSGNEAGAASVGREALQKTWARSQGKRTPGTAGGSHESLDAGTGNGQMHERLASFEEFYEAHEGMVKVCAAMCDRMDFLEENNDRLLERVKELEDSRDAQAKQVCDRLDAHEKLLGNLQRLDGWGDLLERLAVSRGEALREGGRTPRPVLSHREALQEGGCTPRPRSKLAGSGEGAETSMLHRVAEHEAEAVAVGTPRMAKVPVESGGSVSLCDSARARVTLTLPLGDTVKQTEAILQKLAAGGASVAGATLVETTSHEAQERGRAVTLSPRSAVGSAVGSAGPAVWMSPGPRVINRRATLGSVGTAHTSTTSPVVAAIASSVTASPVMSSPRSVATVQPLQFARGAWSKSVPRGN